MEKNQFKRILFKTAFCCMACDGHIDDREIKEMEGMNRNTIYFEDVDLSVELEGLVNQFQKKGKKTVEELFEQLKKTDLNTVQELLLLEVALRMINADEVIDENEKKFLRFLRSKLKVHDETLLDRFGKISYLFDVDYKESLTKVKTPEELLESMTLPKIDEMKLIEFSDQNKS
jgi:uncharacterized tellurite resistance protein B-like protein